MDLTLESLKTERPDLVEAIGAAALEAFQSSEEVKAAKAASEAKIKELSESSGTLKKELDALKAEKALVEQRAAVDKEIIEAKLPEALITKLFREGLYQETDAEKRKLLIEERQQIAQLKDAGEPLSTEQQRAGDANGGTEMTTEQFATQLTEGGI